MGVHCCHLVPGKGGTSPLTPPRSADLELQDPLGEAYGG